MTTIDTSLSLDNDSANTTFPYASPSAQRAKLNQMRSSAQASASTTAAASAHAPAATATTTTTLTATHNSTSARSVVVTGSNDDLFAVDSALPSALTQGNLQSLPGSHSGMHRRSPLDQESDAANGFSHEDAEASSQQQQQQRRPGSPDDNSWGDARYAAATAAPLSVTLSSHPSYHRLGGEDSAKSIQRKGSVSQRSRSRKPSAGGFVASFGRRRRDCGCNDAAAPTRDNFFFFGDSVPLIGVGTVGLNASKAVPVHVQYASTIPGKNGQGSTMVGASFASHAGSAGGGSFHSHHQQQQQQRRYSQCGGSGFHVSGDRGGGGGVDGNSVSCDHGKSGDVVVRNYYSTACYRTPASGVPPPWERREKEYEDWRTRQIKKTVYHSFNGVEGGGGGGEDTQQKSATKPTNSCTGRGDGKGRDNAGNEECDPDEPLIAVDPKVLYAPEELAQFENMRLRVIAKDRKQKEAARVAEQEAREAELLERRHRRLHGEAVDMPNAYYEVVVLHQQKRMQQMLPGGRGASALAPTINPDTITASDHRKAMGALRLQRQMQKAAMEEARHECAQEVRKDISTQLAQSRSAAQAHQDAMLAGVSRISRSEAAARAEATAEQHRQQAGVYKVERDAWRQNESLHRQQQLEDDQWRQQQLRLKINRPVSNALWSAPMADATGTRQVVCMHDSDDYNKHNSEGTNLKSIQPAPAAAAPQHSPVAEKTPISSAIKTSRAPALATVAVRAEAPVNTDMAALQQQQQQHQPTINTSSFFLAEIKQWQDTFCSPNQPSLSANDPVYRREWLRRLSEERRAFNDITVQRGKEVTMRVCQSREECLDKRFQSAEKERGEKAELQQRKDVLEKESRRRIESCHGEQRWQLDKVREVRREQEDEKRKAAELQRKQMKYTDLVMSTLEEEELKALRESIQAAKC